MQPQRFRHLSITLLFCAPLWVSAADLTDSDNDGITDVWEKAFQLDPQDATDATADADHDGLNNRDEYLLGSNPLVADTGRLPNYVLYWDDIINAWEDFSPNMSWLLHVNAGAAEKALVAGDLHSTAVTPYSGQYALAMEPTRWRFMNLQHNNIQWDAWQTLEFYVHGGDTGGQVLQVRTVGSNLLGSKAIKQVNVNDYISGGTVAANTWRRVSIPLSELLDATGTVSYLQIGYINGTPNSVYYLDDIHLAADPNPAPALQIQVDTQQVQRALPATLFGVNGASWMTDLHADPVVAQVNALGSTVIRYPGGSSADTFDWLSNNAANATPSQAWQTTTDDYFQLLSKTGAAGMITTNFGTGNAQQAGDWAAYAKNMGANVPYWEVGNEIYGSWETSWTHDGAAYVQGDATHDGANAYCAAIKAANPTAQVSLVGTIIPNDANNFGPKALAVADACFDYYSIHHYFMGPGKVDYAALLSAANADIPAIAQNVRSMLAASPNASHLKIALTEYNAYYSAPEAPTAQTANMLFMAEMVGQAAQQGFDVATAWSLGVTPDNPPGSRYGLLQNYLHLDRQPTYFAYPLWRMSGDQLLTSTTNRSASRELSVYASKHQASGDITLLVINKTPQTQTGTIKLNPFYAAGTADVYTVAGTSLAAEQVSFNGDMNPPVDLTSVAPVTLTGIGSSFAHSFPAYSISSITIHAGSKDTTPDTFAFAPHTRVPLNSSVESDNITISGINAPTPIRVSSGSEYRINGGAYTTATGSVSNGDTVNVRHTAAATISTNTFTLLNIGGVKARFKSVTEPKDIKPDTFQFNAIQHASRATLIESNSITVSGINSPAPLRVTTGGSYSINGGAYTTENGVIKAGDQVKVRRLSAAKANTTVSSTLFIGGIPGKFTLTTAP